MKGLLIIILCAIILFFVIRKILKNNRKKAEREERHAKFVEEIKHRQEKLPALIKEANELVDKYEQRIIAGQDKYLIGQALYDIDVEYHDKFHRCFAAGCVPPAYKQKFSDFRKRISDICDTDISIERGYKDAKQKKKKTNK